ncbi:MAG TPA: hydrogenase maturation nickel metallochaperone HypA [Anaerolineae bacterium]|nr:hydrogenase maturation nickel metallochaperone HypA [Anaerolineae bacterium]HID84356.1 hydrogenase maturation nickel metallochaperone HypA [Anaerolineales bacterium]HIQ09854.1 hydrogenase maturation nickel metallochaperone HypA [Anaerolineaceae bacterium]
MDRHEQVVRQLVSQACEQANGKPVLEVWLAVALCAELDDKNLHFYWDKWAAGTPCHGAKLHVRQVKYIQECPQCGHIFPANDLHEPCPECNTRHSATLVGEDCVLLERIATYEGR